MFKNIKLSYVQFTLVGLFLLHGIIAIFNKEEQLVFFNVRIIHS
ncbi:hypothetical protein ACED96_11305 [Clostridium thermobutyricum]